MTTKDFSKRLEELISLFDTTISTSTPGSGFALPSVNGEKFNEARSASLSFIKNLFGITHPYYIDFNIRVTRNNPSEASY